MPCTFAALYLPAIALVHCKPRYYACRTVKFYIPSVLNLLLESVTFLQRFACMTKGLFVQSVNARSLCNKILGWFESIHE